MRSSFPPSSARGFVNSFRTSGYSESNVHPLNEQAERNELSPGLRFAEEEGKVASECLINVIHGSIELKDLSLQATHFTKIPFFGAKGRFYT
jgi:hypothetical protein